MVGVMRMRLVIAALCVLGLVATTGVASTSPASKSFPVSRPVAAAYTSVSSTVPVGSRVVFTGNYDTFFLNQWRSLQTRDWSMFPGYRCTYSACVRYDSPAHPSAARFEVRDGDVPPFGGGERSEVLTGDGVTGGASVFEGDERWYEFSVKFDPTFRSRTTGSTGWLIVMQWLPGNGAPPLALQVSMADTLDLGGGAVPREFHRPLGPVRPGVWVDYVLHVKFSNDADVGFVEAWENGVLVLPRLSRPTMSSDRNILKQGVYRNADEIGTHIVWHDGLRVTAP